MPFSRDFEYGTIDYFKLRVPELEKARDDKQAEINYYQKELAKAHELLGRVTHQLSERWDSARLTQYFPTDNLHNKRNCNNPKGE